VPVSSRPSRRPRSRRGTRAPSVGPVGWVASTGRGAGRCRRCRPRRRGRRRRWGCGVPGRVDALRAHLRRRTSRLRARRSSCPHRCGASRLTQPTLGRDGGLREALAVSGTAITPTAGQQRLNWSCDVVLAAEVKRHLPRQYGTVEWCGRRTRTSTPILPASVSFASAVTSGTSSAWASTTYAAS
jgi:hypothetical protein